MNRSLSWPSPDAALAASLALLAASGLLGAASADPAPAPAPTCTAPCDDGGGACEADDECASGLCLAPRKTPARD